MKSFLKGTISVAIRVPEIALALGAVLAMLAGTGVTLVLGLMAAVLTKIREGVERA